MVELLTREGLDAWLARWRAHSVPYVDAWRPGLDDAAIAAVEEERGVTLPPELRTWWQWRDGTGTVEKGGRRVSVWAVPGILLFGCEQAFQVTRAFRELVGPPTEVADSWIYQDRWLQIGTYGNGDMVFADLQPSSAGASEIRSAWLEDLNDPPGSSVPSLGTLVRWWSDAIDNGVYWWDDEIDQWAEGPEPVPEHQRRTGLV